MTTELWLCYLLSNREKNMWCSASVWKDRTEYEMLHRDPVHPPHAEKPLGERWEEITYPKKLFKILLWEGSWLSRLGQQRVSLWIFSVSLPQLQANKRAASRRCNRCKDEESCHSLATTLLCDLKQFTWFLWCSLVLPRKTGGLGYSSSQVSSRSKI